VSIPHKVVQLTLSYLYGVDGPRRMSGFQALSELCRSKVDGTSWTCTYVLLTYNKQKDHRSTDWATSTCIGCIHVVRPYPTYTPAYHSKALSRNPYDPPSSATGQVGWGGGLQFGTAIYKSSNTGWISADRSSKATLPLTIPSSSKVVCNGFTPMTFEIVISGYALAFGKTECILSRVTSLGDVIPHLDTLLT
jgi:hypothetical protein